MENWKAELWPRVRLSCVERVSLPHHMENTEDNSEKTHSEGYGNEELGNFDPCSSWTMIGSSFLSLHPDF